jgi:hypothetical protein
MDNEIVIALTTDEMALIAKLEAAETQQVVTVPVKPASKANRDYPALAQLVMDDCLARHKKGGLFVVETFTLEQIAGVLKQGKRRSIGGAIRHFRKICKDQRKLEQAVKVAVS